MKRKIGISVTIITLVVLFCNIVFYATCQRKSGFVDGIIVTKNEQFFTIETDIQEKIVGYWPEKYDYTDISLGDNIRVYYSGEILEISPARIKNIKRIEKK